MVLRGCKGVSLGGNSKSVIKRGSQRWRTKGLREGLREGFKEGSNEGSDKELRIGFHEGCRRRGFQMSGGDASSERSTVYQYQTLGQY
jgi:hypothetical protein